jgi:hypothetical protein
MYIGDIQNIYHYVYSNSADSYNGQQTKINHEKSFDLMGWALVWKPNSGWRVVERINDNSERSGSGPPTVRKSQTQTYTFFVLVSSLLKFINIAEFEKIYVWVRKTQNFLRNLRFDIISVLVTPNQSTNCQ